LLDSCRQDPNTNSKLDHRWPQPGRLQEPNAHLGNAGHSGVRQRLGHFFPDGLEARSLRLGGAGASYWAIPLISMAAVGRKATVAEFRL